MEIHLLDDPRLCTLETGTYSITVDDIGIPTGCELFLIRRFPMQGMEISPLPEQRAESPAPPEHGPPSASYRAPPSRSPHWHGLQTKNCHSALESDDWTLLSIRDPSHLYIRGEHNCKVPFWCKLYM